MTLYYSLVGIFACLATVKAARTDRGRSLLHVEVRAELFGTTGVQLTVAADYAPPSEMEGPSFDNMADVDRTKDKNRDLER